eukprot:COSAG04_NODE_12742_length_637_cov_1.146840_3_plen_85_part_01
MRCFGRQTNVACTHPCVGPSELGLEAQGVVHHGLAGERDEAQLAAQPPDVRAVRDGGGELPTDGVGEEPGRAHRVGCDIVQEVQV